MLVGLGSRQIVPSRTAVEYRPSQIEGDSAGQVGRVCPRKTLLLAKQRFPSWNGRDVQRRIISRVSLLDPGVRGTYLRHLLQKIGALRQRAIDGGLHRVANRVRNGQVFEGLDLNRGGRSG